MTNLRDARIAAGYGFIEAAEKLGIGRATLWRYENGQVQRPDHRLIERMSALYKVRRRRKAADQMRAGAITPARKLEVTDEPA